jgi:serine/threonine protein kinase
MAVGVSMQTEIKQEFQVLLRLRHPNIVAVIALELDKKFARIFMEWMPGGSLSSVVSQTGALPEVTAAKIFRGLLEALAFTHASGVVHRDIKPLNMLMAADGSVKLSDFGTAHFTRVDTEEKGRTGARVTGTIPYMCPDVVQGVIDPANDVWALAVSLNEVVSGELPWMELRLSGLPLMARIGKIDASTPREEQRPAIASGISPRLKNLLEACMAVDRTRRPTAQALLADPYFAAV